MTQIAECKQHCPEMSRSEKQPFSPNCRIKTKTFTSSKASYQCQGRDDVGGGPCVRRRLCDLTGRALLTNKTKRQQHRTPESLPLILPSQSAGYTCPVDKICGLKHNMHPHDSLLFFLLLCFLWSIKSVSLTLTQAGTVDALPCISFRKICLGREHYS